ncbi:hypothetical protein HanRHA438_Chr08g0362531 [Helianthus annuus]|nr:hypothetical protein HanRHA438_Chr08g0362531 [Helianthus annuus]
MLLHSQYHAIIQLQLLLESLMHGKPIPIYGSLKIKTYPIGKQAFFFIRLKQCQLELLLRWVSKLNSFTGKKKKKKKKQTKRGDHDKGTSILTLLISPSSMTALLIFLNNS